MDVLNELINWLRGAPQKLAKAHIGSENPKEALEKTWEQLDFYYIAQIQTASERIKPILAKGKINKDDVDGLIDLVSDLLAVQTQMKNAGMEQELDRQDIVRELVTKKLPYMSEEFYKRETKMQKKDPKFRMDYDDLVQAIRDRARTLKAQGLTSKKEEPQTAKVAAAQGTNKGGKWSDKVASPPKEQPQGRKCLKCKSLRHGMDKCNELMNMEMPARVEFFKSERVCFNCMGTDHMSKWCKEEGLKCEKDGMNHPTVLSPNGIGYPEITRRTSGVFVYLQGSNL